MASYSNKLVNPTPFQVEWTYDRGVEIVIEPDSSVELNPDMTSQFRPDTPNTEAIRQEMGQHGIFLEDLHRSWDEQAMEAIEKCVQFKRGMLNAAKANLRKDASRNGAFSEDSFNEMMQQLGYDVAEEKIAKLEDRLKRYKRSVQKPKRVKEAQLDPTRTLVFKDPPQVFPTALAMEIYLEEHPEEKNQYEAWLAQMKAAKRTERSGAESR